MKKAFNLICLLFIGFWASAQTISSNTVTYKITYDQSTSKYTVWVVPEYNTPNANNSGTNEKGPTAQTTLALPCSVNITSITDITGIWQKPNSNGWIKLSPSTLTGGSALDPNTCYYVIGKSPTETDYGQFTSGTAIPLYSFTTDGCAGVVRIIGANDPVISVAVNQNSLNVANSFYSLSGQPNNTGGNQDPIEQFRDKSGYDASCSITATSDNTTTAYNTPVTQSVLANDLVNGAAANSTNAIITITQQPSCGTATVNSAGTVTYTPTSSCTGNQCYTYQICAAATPTFCTTAQNCITVGGVSLVATPESTTTPFNTPVSQSVLSNDTNNGVTASPSNVNLTITQQPSCGSVSVNATTGVATYTPTSSCTGTQTYTYQICDKSVTTSCTTATNTVTISSAPIVATPESTNTTAGTPVTVNVLNNDTFNGAPATTSNVTLSIASNPTHGTVSIVNGAVVYTPNPGYTGTDSFTYQICAIGSTTNCTTATDNITIGCAPISATTDAVSVTASGTTTTSVLSNDTNNGATATTSNVSLTITTPPVNGTATVNSNGTITYTATGTATSDSYTYRICSTSSTTCCSSATNTVSIAATTLQANPDAITTSPGTAVTTSVLTNDTRNGVAVSPSQVNVSVVTNPTKGTTTVNSDGTITYTPNSSFTSGTDTYTYQICDKTQPTVCSTATVTVTLGGSVTTDISVVKTVNNTTANLNDILAYTITVKNNGPLDASAIAISDVLQSTNLTLIASNPATGTYSTGTGVWTIPSLANGASTTLSIQAKVIAEGVTNNTASLTGFNGTDSNNSNNSSSVCTSVPVSLCEGQTLALSVPSTYTNVVWYKNGTQVATGSSYTATGSGAYTWTASNNTCPVSGCCPINIISTVCCATNVCVPVTVLKSN